MRVTDKKDGFSLHAISGTRAVMLAMNARDDVLDDFLGFGIGFRQPDNSIRWMNGFKCFETVEPDPDRAQRFRTNEHPIQGFQWGHYSADPETSYAYVIRPLFRPANGDLTQLEQRTRDLEVTISTEAEDDGTHSVLFNRGAIVSQAYAERFGNDDTLTEQELADQLNDADAERTKWLSRGLLEGALAYIGQATSSRFSLHCAFYELTYPPILQALADAAARGATVEISFEADHFSRKHNIRRDSKQGVRNRAAIQPFLNRPNLHFRERIHHNAIPHNKFIVLKDNGTPVQVWTGSTNITPSGFCGQSNTGHIVRDQTVAGVYADYFDLLAVDTQREALKAFTGTRTPNPPAALPDGTTPLFSPRVGSSMLDWYGERISEATQTVLLTSAFGVTTRLAHYFDNDVDYLRYVLMEQRSRGKGAQEMVERDRDTRVVFGQGLGYTGSLGHWRKIPGFKLEHWMWREHHFRSSGHVFFIHTKYMGIDVLSDDPKIFTGSANFSPNSLTSNDENMLLIRGNTRVADVYTTEFFRLLNHFYFRQVANRKAQDGQSDPSIRFLDEDDSWVAGHFRAQNYRSKRRELFGVGA